MRKPQRAFTLVELLIVIGIIAVLIGILIPVIGAVRKAAYAASSRNNIKTIANAIDSYQVTYLAYPGVFSNAQITAGVNPGAGANITMSENCLLALAGGLTGATGTTYTATDVGRGPLTFGTPQKRLPGFVDATNKAMSTNGSDLDPSANWGSTVPEFIDAFPSAMPIIYLRARVGSAGLVDASGAANGEKNQYNPQHMSPYFNAYASAPGGISTTDFADVKDSSGSNIILNKGLEAYFGDGSLSSWATTPAPPHAVQVPKRKDTYMLISPGDDRKYGTSDDICNFSF
jgi:prepilin-type N-terminal cleavage/methylation domain-containing protein